MYSIVVYRKEVVEVNFELAVEVGMVSEHRHGKYDVYDWWLPVEILINIDPTTHKIESREQPITYKDYFIKNLEFATRQPRWVMTVIEGELWREYASDKYWEK